LLWRHKKKANIEAKEQPKDNDIKDWITVNGVHIPIKKGQNKDDVVDDFISKQKDDEPKKDKPKTDTKDVYDISSYNNDNNRIKVKVDKVLPDYERHVDIIRNVWNDIPDSDKQGINDFVIGSPPKGHEGTAGSFDPNSNTLGVHLSGMKIDEKSSTEEIRNEINTVLIHELAHSAFHKKDDVTQGDWSFDVMQYEPITDYLKKYKEIAVKAEEFYKEQRQKRNQFFDELEKIDKEIKSGNLSDKSDDVFAKSPLQKAKDEKASLERSIDNLNPIVQKADLESKIARITYGNETHSEFMVMFKGHKPLWKTNEDVFNKLKPIYNEYFGAKN
jgi:hypothetical protein